MTVLLFGLAKRGLAVLAMVLVVMAVYLVWARPYQMHWGAGDQEVRGSMPGDNIESDPQFFATRAITIPAKPEAIWPWLLQMGYGRAGYYGYDILENPGSPRGIRSADAIIPEFQRFRVGDVVPISTVSKMRFQAIEPNRYLIWTGMNGKGSFLWALEPTDNGDTRLISRIRWSFHWSQPRLLVLDLFTEFTDFLAVRKILYGVGDRVAGRTEPMVVQVLEVAAYVGTALAFAVAALLLLIRPLTMAGWLAGLYVGAMWLFTWYAPVPLWIGAMLTAHALWVMIGGGLWDGALPHRHRRTH